VDARAALVGIVRKHRVLWSIASGLGQAIALAGVALANAIGRGERISAALPFVALIAAVGFVVGSGAAYLAAKLRGMGWQPTRQGCEGGCGTGSVSDTEG